MTSVEEVKAMSEDSVVATTEGTGTGTETETDTPTIIIYAIPGSQFVFKVLAAIQARNIPHYVYAVPFDATARKKMMPTGDILVPVLQVGITKEDRTIVTDSEKILHWFDENYNMMGTKLFPDGTDGKASELSIRASTKTLAGSVWYYNYVNDVGYKKSLQKTAINTVFPSWVPYFLTSTVVNAVVSGTRAKYRKQAAQALDLANEMELDDEPMVRSKVIEELKFFQTLLPPPPPPTTETTTSSSEGDTSTDNSKICYLLPTSDEQPSAVDFSVYAQVQRLVGTATGIVATDVEIGAAVPELLDNKELEPLWKWFKHMQTTYPVYFRNKNVPTEIRKSLGL